MKKKIQQWRKIYYRLSPFIGPIVIVLLIYDINDRKEYQNEAEQRGVKLIRNDSIAKNQRDTLSINQDTLLSRNLKIIDEFINQNK